MKNTTKKILSLILAVIMLLSVMPFGFSAEAKLSIEGQELVSAYVKMMSYQHNRYKQGDNILNSQIREITNIQSKACNEVINRYGWNVETYDYLNDSANAQAIEESTQIYKAAIKDIEHFLEEQEITIVIDTYEYTMIAQYERLYSDEEIVTAEKAVEKNTELFEEASYFYSEAGKLLDEFNAQEEFDVYWKQGMPVWEMFYNCLDGNHPYGEYISNNDATEEADGTKTATCDFCGATDTVTDEGSKIVNNNDNNDNSSCSCNCHKKGFSAFIWKILCFFYKIFGMNKTCACGIAHY